MLPIEICLLLELETAVFVNLRRMRKHHTSPKKLEFFALDLHCFRGRTVPGPAPHLTGFHPSL